MTDDMKVHQNWHLQTHQKGQAKVEIITLNPEVF